MFRDGYLHVGSWRGAPVRFHWTTALGAVFFGRFRFVPAFWVTFVGIILIHEMGHAWMVLRFRQRVVSIDVHGIGGWCRWSGAVAALPNALIAWGGVLAQGILLAATLLVVAVFGPATDAFSLQLQYALTWTNLWIIGLNLLPFPPFDGHEAWPIVKIFKMRWQTKRNIRRNRREAQEKRREKEEAAQRDLEALEALEDEAPEAGMISIRICESAREVEAAVELLQEKGVRAEIRGLDNARFEVLVAISDAGKAAAILTIADAKREFGSR